MKCNFIIANVGKEKNNIFTTLNLFSLTTSLHQLPYRIIRHNYENKCWLEKLMPELKSESWGGRGTQRHSVTR